MDEKHSLQQQRPSSSNDRRARRIMRSSRRQTAEIVNLVPPYNPSPESISPTGLNPSESIGLPMNLLHRSQSQPPAGANTPRLLRRGGGDVLTSTESTSQVSGAVGNTSLRASLRRMERCLGDRGSCEGNNGGGVVGEHSGSSSSLSDRQTRILNRRSISDRSTSDSHLTALSRIGNPQATEIRPVLAVEDDDDVELEAMEGDEFPLLPQPSNNSTILTAPNIFGRVPYERFSLLRRSEGIGGQPSLASLAHQSPHHSQTSLSSSPPTSSSEFPPSYARIVHEDRAEEETLVRGTNSVSESLPLTLRLLHQSASSTDSNPSNSIANQEPESDHDFFTSESTRLPFRSSDQTQRAFLALNDLRRRGLLCDVRLRAGDTEVAAHKNVLAASSPYFLAMFTGEMTEKTASVVKIGNVNGTALSALVDFIYTSEVIITEETVQTLLPAANLLQLSSVREACCEFLQCQLHPSNCLGIQRFADMHDCSELLLVSRRFTEQHCSEVLEQGEEFLNLSKDQLIQLIASDHIRVSEEAVFEAVLRWIRARPDSRQQVEAAEICSHVRFALLPRDYLVRLSQSDAFLYQNPWCKDYLLEAMGYHLLPWEHKRRVTTERMRQRTVGLPKTLVVLGGQAPKAIRSVECYDFRTDTWTASGSSGPPFQPSSSMGGVGDSLLPDLPSRRCRCGVALLGGLVYVIGGFNGALRVRSVDIFDPVRRAWRAGPNMEYRRSTLGVAVLDGVIYAVGGFNGAKGFASVEAFDPWVGAWKPVAPMTVSRSSVGVGVLGGRVYAVGGYDGQSRRCLASVEAFNPRENRWEAVRDMNQRRSGPAVAEMEGRLYVVGGHDGLLVRNSAEYLDPKSGVWCGIVDMHFCRRNAGLVSHNGMLYALGGDDGTSNLGSVETYDSHSNIWTLLPSHMNTGRCYAGVVIVDWSIV